MRMEANPTQEIEYDEEKMEAAFETLDAVFDGMTVMEVTFIIGTMIGEFVDNKDQIGAVCSMIMTAALEAKDNLIEIEVANELPV